LLDIGIQEFRFQFALSQIIPAGNMPTYGKKYQKDGKLVICNLQPTKQDKKADLCIHTYVDDVLKMLMQRLDLDIPEYDPVFDPVKQVETILIILTILICPLF